MDTILNSAKEVLGETKVSALDSARFVRNILDAKPSDSKLTDAQFILKVIEVGLCNIRAKEMSLADGFALYLRSKQHLRPDSVRDIRCIGNRLLRTNPELGERNFSELNVSECEEWLNAAFHTDNQFNKARAMLHGLFEFALRREWCDKNPIKRIERKKVVEKEIQPLKLSETKRLIKTAQNESPEYAIVAALLVYTGTLKRILEKLNADGKKTVVLDLHSPLFSEMSNLATRANGIYFVFGKNGKKRNLAKGFSLKLAERCNKSGGLANNPELDVDFDPFLHDRRPITFAKWAERLENVMWSAAMEIPFAVPAGEMPSTPDQLRNFGKALLEELDAHAGIVWEHSGK